MIWFRGRHLVGTAMGCRWSSFGCALSGNLSIIYWTSLYPLWCWLCCWYSRSWRQWTPGRNCQLGSPSCWRSPCSCFFSLRSHHSRRITLLCSVIITVTSLWAEWRLKSPALRLFTQPFVQVQMKENIKALRHWPLWGEFTGDCWIPHSQRASDAENVSIWSRHHDDEFYQDNCILSCEHGIVCHIDPSSPCGACIRQQIKPSYFR